jgi:tetratricopeptide (TPR) repeat protein
MSNVVGMRLVSLSAFVLLCVVAALFATSWLASRSGIRSAANSSPSVERVVTVAQRLLNAGRPREALHAISGVTNEAPQSPEVLLVKGLALVAFGDSEQARQALLRSIAINPNQPMAVKVLAAIAFSRGEEQRGLEYLARAAALDPGDFRPLYAIGEVHLRMGRMDAAIRAFDAALLRKTDHEESRIGLLTASLVIRPPDTSSDFVRELLRDYPQNPQVQVLAARHALALGDDKAALGYAGRAIELNPDFVYAIVLRAQLLRMTGATKPALAEATRAVQRDSSNPQALAILAQLQAAMGQAELSRVTLARHHEVLEHSERIRELTDQIAQHPDDPAPRWKLGQVAVVSGAIGLATESYRAALALDPQCQPALVGLRSLHETVAPAIDAFITQTSSLPDPGTAAR